MNPYYRLVDDLTELMSQQPEHFDTLVHRAIEQAKHPHKLARDAVRAAMRRTGTTQEQWEEAADILFKKEEHAAIKILKEGYAKVLKALKTAEDRMEATKRVGAGRTVAPDLLVAEVVPAIEELSEDCAIIAKQMRAKFK